MNYLQKDLDATFLCRNSRIIWDMNVLDAYDAVVFGISFQDFTVHTPYLRTLLSCEERERAERFYFERDTLHSVISRGMLRLVLSGFLDVEPAVIEFGYNEFGKPFIANSRMQGTLDFNLSHSDEKLVIGVSGKGLIGVDIEKKKHIEDMRNVARLVFSEEEMSVLQRVEDDLLSQKFYVGWVQKEAFSKAVGMGFSYNFHEIKVDFAESLPFEAVYKDRHVVVREVGADYLSCHVLCGREFRAR